MGAHTPSAKAKKSTSIAAGQIFTLKAAARKPHHDRRQIAEILVVIPRGDRKLVCLLVVLFLDLPNGECHCVRVGRHRERLVLCPQREADGALASGTRQTLSTGFDANATQTLVHIGIAVPANSRIGGNLRTVRAAVPTCSACPSGFNATHPQAARTIKPCLRHLPNARQRHDGDKEEEQSVGREVAGDRTTPHLLDGPCLTPFIL